jgi:hypothetical protein
MMCTTIILCCAIWTEHAWLRWSLSSELSFTHAQLASPRLLRLGIHAAVTAFVPGRIRGFFRVDFTFCLLLFLQTSLPCHVQREEGEKSRLSVAMHATTVPLVDQVFGKRTPATTQLHHSSAAQSTFLFVHSTKKRRRKRNGAKTSKQGSFTLTAAVSQTTRSWPNNSI